jgi:hypothetical protein
MTASAIAGLALIAATVNARMLLLGAGLRPWLGPLPAWQVYPALHLLTDPGWIVAMRDRADGGSDAAVLVGGGTADRNRERNHSRHERQDEPRTEPETFERPVGRG